MMTLLENARYDSIIIWGHGLQYTGEILAMIRDEEGFEIVRIVKHKPKSMKNFIRKVYSYDYAPLAHLKSKISYLNKIDPCLICVVVNNLDSQVDILGEGGFRHKESIKLKDLKTRIRERFNPYRMGEMTHDHVIHATDNEEQTHHILNAIGDIPLINYYLKNLYSIPFFLGEQNEYEVAAIKSDLLLCGQIIGDSDRFRITNVPVKDSIQYHALFGKEKAYQEYVTRHLGCGLKSDYHVEKFLLLSKGFRYLSCGFENSYVVVKKIEDNNYLIVDGLHRASLHLSQGNTKIIVCVIK